MLTMHDGCVRTDVIHRFMDHLSTANITVLQNRMLPVVMIITDELRNTVPSDK
jgi:hypothetical protein